jgi:hypothetical protein
MRMRLRALRSLVSTILLTATAASALSLPASMTNPASATGGVMLGVYRDPRGSDFRTSLGRLETYLGRKVDIDHHFYSWKSAFPGTNVQWDKQMGRYSMISWAAPGPVTSINSGSYDSWIKQQAVAMKSFGKTVFVRFLWEMNLRTDLSVSPTAFINAWRRIFNIFHSNGALNVKWVWCPNSSGFANGTSQSYWPGGSYVDWICADGYNWGTSTDQSQWRSFGQIFGSFYSWAASKGKPLMIGEVGCMEGLSAQKSTWMTNTRSALKSTYPAIKAFVYFDAYASAFHGGTYNWRVDTTGGAYTAFKNMGLDTYFRPSHIW